MYPKVGVPSGFADAWKVNTTSCPLSSTGDPAIPAGWLACLTRGLPTPRADSLKSTPVSPFERVLSNSQTSSADSPAWAKSVKSTRDHYA